MPHFLSVDLSRDEMRSVVTKGRRRLELILMWRLLMVICSNYSVLVFLKKPNSEIQKTFWAQHPQVHRIQKEVMGITTQGVPTSDSEEVVSTLIPDSTGRDIGKLCQSIYPLHDVLIRKVKLPKKPVFELGKLVELHGRQQAALEPLLGMRRGEGRTS